MMKMQALTHRAQARMQKDMGSLTHKIRADWSLTSSHLVGERGGERVFDVALDQIMEVSDESALRGSRLFYRPFRGRVLRLVIEDGERQHLLGIPMSDPSTWVDAIEASKRR